MYTLAVTILLTLLVIVAGALATSISEFVASIPQIKEDLPAILAPWQAWLDSLGLANVDLVVQVEALLANLDKFAGASWSRRSRRSPSRASARSARC